MGSARKYVIESDGTIKGTKISVNGSEISGATSFSFEMFSSEQEVDVKIRFQEKEKTQTNNKIGF